MSLLFCFFSSQVLLIRTCALTFALFFHIPISRFKSTCVLLDERHQGEEAFEIELWGFFALLFSVVVMVKELLCSHDDNYVHKGRALFGGKFVAEV